MTLLFVALPLVVLFLSFFRLDPRVTHPGGMAVCVVLAGWNLYEVALCGAVKKITLVENFLSVPTPLGWESVGVGVFLDFYSANTVWIVFVISFFVHLYSTSYMSGDPRLHLFLSYLTLFTFFMVVLLVAPNYLQLFLGWEGVGLTSYLLVNFWHTRAAANKSALKALIVNRVGDFFLLYLLFFVVVYHGGTNFTDSMVAIPSAVATVVGVFLVVAAAAKSAQLGLHTWLPDAMEGPTPVSALIHAATMVTAGVFLLLRSTWLLSEVTELVLFLGAATTFFAGSVALFQFDLKRVIAYSTCAQLGYMVVAVGVDSPELSLYHLLNHAYFKALLFLLAGLVIHALADEQDTRRMGGLARVLPVTYMLFVVGSLALVGFPFLSGYYSKEGILEILYTRQHWWAYGLCLLGAYFTAYYSFRTVYLVFFGRPRGSRGVYLAVAEADTLSLTAVTSLGVAALFHGFLSRDLFVGLGRTTGWSTPYLESEFALPLVVKLLPLGLSLLASLVCYSCETYRLVGGTPGVGVTRFLAKRWWWDFVDSAAARSFLTGSYTVYVDLERGLLEWCGPKGLRFTLGRAYEVVRNRGWFPTFFALLGSSLVVVVVVLMVGFVDGVPPTEVK